MALDLEAARRQSFTVSYDETEIAELLDGRLTMAPHPTWELPADPTWQEDPFQDRNWTFQYHMLRWLDPLRRAALKGVDEAFDMWLRWIQDWAAKNPVDAPASPWAWTDMSDGIRAQQLCFSAPLLHDRRPDLLDWLETTIRVHTDHLCDPKNIGNANHALHQAESLFVCGRVLQDDAATDLATRRLSALLHEQYDEQGVNAEGAIAYHVNNYLWWERTLRRYDKEKLPRPSGAERHLHAPEEIAHATRPDGTLVQIGDTDIASPEKVKHPMTAYAATNGEDGEPPSRTLAVYDAGYVFGRSGWGDDERPLRDQTFFSLRFGPSRTVHGHPDGGSVTYSAGGVNWIVDPGKYEYGASEPRKHFFSRRAHSLATIEKKKVKRSAEVRLIRRATTPTHHEFVLADDSFGRLHLTRRLIYSIQGEYLVVIDEASSRRPITLSQRWQLGADVTSALTGSDAVALTQGDVGAVLCPLGGATVTMAHGQTEPFDGWVSTGWRTKAPATAVIARVTASSPRLVTVLAHARGRTPRARMSTGWLNRNILRITVETETAHEVVTVAPDSAEIAGSISRRR